MSAHNQAARILLADVKRWYLFSAASFVLWISSIAAVSILQRYQGGSFNEYNDLFFLSKAVFWLSVMVMLIAMYKHGRLTPQTRGKAVTTTVLTLAVVLAGSILSLGLLAPFFIWGIVRGIESVEMNLLIEQYSQQVEAPNQ